MATKKKAAKKAAKRAKKAAPKKKAAAKKKAARRVSLVGDNASTSSLVLSAEFRLGKGEITAKLFRGTKLIQSETLDKTGSATFQDARTGDELSITGACAGNAKISTDRDTTPASTPSDPLKFSKENIFAILGIN